MLEVKFIPTYSAISLPSYLPICLFISLHTYLSIYLSTYLPIYFSTYLPIYLSLYLPSFLSIYLSTYLPIYLSHDHCKRLFWRRWLFQSQQLNAAFASEGLRRDMETGKGKLLNEIGEKTCFVNKTSKQVSQLEKEILFPTWISTAHIRSQDDSEMGRIRMRSAKMHGRFCFASKRVCVFRSSIYAFKSCVCTYDLCTEHQF